MWGEGDRRLGLEYDVLGELRTFLRRQNSPPPAPAAAPPPKKEEELPPFEKIKPEFTFKDLVLPPSLKSEFDSLLEDHEFEKELGSEGIKVRRTLMLHGPPGCGKTSVAHALANSLGMDFYYVSVADALSAYMGDSEKNVMRALDYAHENRIVLLLDEFDSLAAKRIQADRAGATENNRIVNTLLVGLDQKPPKGIIVACTNFYDSIDAAIKRRFKLKLEIPQATRDTLKKIAAKGLKSSLDPAIEDVLAACSTPAEVADMCMDIRRRRVVEEARKKKIEIPGLDLEARVKELSRK